MSKQWYAIKVKWRSEKLVMAMLQKKKVTCFTPMQQRVKLYTRKRVSTMMPILPCYVFVHIDPSQYISVLETEYVYQFVKIGQEMSKVHPAEIELLKSLEGLGSQIQTQEVKLVKGQNVRIANGPLTGLKGVIDQIKSKEKVLVNIESIGITLQIEMDRRLLLAQA